MLPSLSRVTSIALYSLWAGLLAHAPNALAQNPAGGVTRIGVIQGKGTAATPGTYTVEGIVTAVYPNLKPGGFYVQESAAASDGNPATSDALFVAQATSTVKVGDLVRLTGSVAEDAPGDLSGQAAMVEPTVTVVSSGNALPAFATITSTTFTEAQLEPFEGMRVEFANPLTVSEVYNLPSRGELTLSSGGVVYQPTQFIDPNDEPATDTTSTGTRNIAAIRAFEAANNSRSILLDDGSAANKPTPIPYLDPALRTMRVGSSVAHLRGILSYGFGKSRVQPLPAPDAPAFVVTRPAVPTFGRLDLKLASFNVLNYFNGDPQGGSLGGGFPTARGAKTPEDFARQRSKLILALAQMNADVIGLTEIENDGTGPESALQDLVSGLNQATAPGTYAFINDGATRQPNNTDAIRCALVYKPAVVKPLGAALADTVRGVFERPPLAQLFTFSRRGHTDTLGVVINHFKSKGSGKGLDADQNDGQGGSNNRRRAQARGLVRFINRRVIPAGARRVISIGDYNANYEEDPLDILRAAHFVTATPPTSASYVFRGLTGSLDHCIITPNLVGFIDVHKWNINSGEPQFLEYDVAGPDTDVRSPFRSSDHDPVLIGVNFAGLAPSNTGAARLLVYPNPASGPRAFKLPSVPESAGNLTLEVLLPQGPPMLRLQGSVAMLQPELNRYTAHLAPGIYLLRLRGNKYQQTVRVMKQ